MDPSQLYNPIKDKFVQSDQKLTPQAWSYLAQLQGALTTIDLSTQVSGELPAANGGTGIDNGTATLTLQTTTGAQSLVTTTSPITAVNLGVTTGVNADSGGIKHARVSTGSIAGGASGLVTVTWGTAFANANYTVVATVLDSTASSLALFVIHVETQTAAAVAVRVLNGAGGALTGTLNVIALHDGA